MFNPICLIHLKPNTPVETLHETTIYHPETIAAKELRRLTGDQVPPRFETDELCEAWIGDTRALIPVEGIQEIIWLDPLPDS